MRLVAIGLAATVATACSWSHAAPPPRPLTLVASATIGVVDWPFEFRWTGAPPTTVVRVHVLDEAEPPVAVIEARGDHVAAPDTLRSTLRAGVRYQWRVARVDENGEEADASSLASFELKD